MSFGVDVHADIKIKKIKMISNRITFLRKSQILRCFENKSSYMKATSTVVKASHQVLTTCKLYNITGLNVQGLRENITICQGFFTLKS